MKKLLVTLALLIPAVTYAQTDDVTLPSPKTDTRTITKWRPTAFAVEVPARQLVVRVVGMDDGGKEVPGSGTIVVVGADTTQVSGFALTVGVSQTCVLKFVDIVGRGSGTFTVNVKKVLQDCL